MRVLIVTAAFWPQVGGIERNLFQLARSLARGGVTVQVLTPAPGQAPDEAFSVVRLPKRYRFYNMDTVMPWAIAEQIRAFKPDVVQTTGPNISELSAILPVKMSGVPSVALYNGDFNQKIFIARNYNRAHVALLRFFDRVLVYTGEMQQSLIARGVDPRKLVVIPPGVADSFGPGPPRAPDPFLLFVGALDVNHAYKRVDLLLSAAQRIFAAAPGFTLKIVGRGPLTERYREMAAGLGIADRVEFLTGVEDRGLAELYRRAYAFVLASSTMQEGFGIVAIEALASGCPVVVTSAVGCAALVRSAANVVVNPGDAEALAQGALSLIAQPARRDEAAVKGEQVAGALRWSALGRRFIDEVYAPLAGGS